MGREEGASEMSKHCTASFSVDEGLRSAALLELTRGHPASEELHSPVASFTAFFSLDEEVCGGSGAAVIGSENLFMTGTIIYPL